MEESEQEEPVEESEQEEPEAESVPPDEAPMSHTAIYRQSAIGLSKSVWVSIANNVISSATPTTSTALRG